jgi:hypothetical protein
MCGVHNSDHAKIKVVAENIKKAEWPGSLLMSGVHLVPIGRPASCLASTELAAVTTYLPTISVTHPARMK